MSYSSFLIAPFKTGLDTDLAPWLLPQDAFSNIINGHVHHGVVEKRHGSTKQGDIVHQDQTNWKVTNISVANPGVVSLTSTAGLTNGDIIEIRNVIGMTEVNGNQYTISGLTGTTFVLSNINTLNFTAWSSAGDVYLIPRNPVMGIERYVDNANIKETLAFDTERVSKFNSTNAVFNPIDSANILNGGDEDYIWTANWASTASSAASSLYRIYFTNGLEYSATPTPVNGIRYYDGGTTTTSFRPQINASSGGVTINGCKLIFAFRQRLLLFNTIEGATNYPQRVRWCQAQAPSISDGWDDNVSGKGGYVDAPTGDQIISAEFLQDTLIVYFTDSVWTLRATADPALPFRWDKINDFRACDAKMSTSQFDRYTIAAGIRGLTATDGVETRRFDERIEDFVVDEINTEAFKKVFTKRSFGQRRMWMLYPSVESSDTDSALIYDEESSALSKYKIDLNVLGYAGINEDASIDDFGDKRLDQFGDDQINDFYSDNGAEFFIGGNKVGEVYLLEQGSDDDEVNFFSDIVGITQANPGVVTITGDIGLSDGDIVNISDVAGMTELNERSFTVDSKSGNTFSLLGEDTSAYSSYVSGGTVGTITSDSIDFELDSAAWNPWVQEGKQCQLGYIDLFVDTHQTTMLTVKFFVDNNQTEYKTQEVNLLPNLFERGSISNITKASQAQITSNRNSLSDGQEIYIYNVEGMNQINGGAYIVTVVDDNNFTIDVDSTNFDDYINGGVITELPFSSTKAWKRIYAGGTGYQHVMNITSSGKDRPLRIHAFMLWFKPQGNRLI